MMQAGGPPASLIIVLRFSEVELERQLYVPRRLGICNLPHRWPNARIRRLKVYMVKRVDEVGAELQLEPLRHLKVLVQAEVQVGVTRCAQAAELRCAVSELAVRRLGKVSVVGEPLDPDSRDSGIRGRRNRVAVWPEAARIGGGIVVSTKDGQGPTGAP